MSVKQSTRFCRAHLCQSATCDQTACLFVCPSHASIMSKLITVGSFGFTQRPANRKFPFESNRIGGYDQNSNRISNLIGGQSFTASKFNVKFLLIIIQEFCYFVGVKDIARSLLQATSSSVHALTTILVQESAHYNMYINAQKSKIMVVSRQDNISMQVDHEGESLEQTLNSQDQTSQQMEIAPKKLKDAQHWLDKMLLYWPVSGKTEI